MEYYQQKFGADRYASLTAAMKKTGAEEGIVFGRDPEAMAPNTLSAHVLMFWASEARNIDTNDLAEKLFHAHHVACENVGDHSVLLRIAREVGLDDSALAEKLQSGTDEGTVTKMTQESNARGISGVPYFILNGQYGLSGAQPANIWLEALDHTATQGASSL